MNRPENWPELLDRHLNEWAYVCFEYGTADCVSFVSAWMKRIGYVEPLEGIPKWSTALGAARAFQSLGGFETAIDGRMIERAHEHYPDSKRDDRVEYLTCL